MPAVPASIVLNNGDGTPVARTFNTKGYPAGGKIGDLIAYEETTQTLQELQPTIEYYTVAQKDGRTRRTQVVRIPIVQTINGVPTKVDENVITMSHVDSPKSTLADRSNGQAYAVNAAVSVDGGKFFRFREGWW